MKKIYFSLLLGVAPLYASAQGSVTLFGILDTYAEYAAGITTTAGGSTSVFRVGSGGTCASRWGLTGTEDLGRGNTALFFLDQGFRLNTGTIAGGAGYAFSRRAYVGIKNDFGKLTMGRDFSLIAYSSPDFDPLYDEQYSSSSLIQYRNQPIYDNTVTFQSASFHGITGATQYGFGNVTGNFQAQRTVGAELRYTSAFFSAVANYDEARDAKGQLSSLFVASREIVLAASTTFGNATLYASYSVLSAPDAAAGTTTHADYGYLGASYQITPSLLTSAGVYHIAAGESGRGTLVGARTEYSLSKKTVFYLNVDHVMNSAGATYAFNGIDAPVPGRSQTGVMAGLRTLF
jgi:predicted porin